MSHRLWLATALVAGCGLIADVRDRELAAPGGGGSGGEAGGGEAGAGGEPEGGGGGCPVEACYDGPAEALGVGLCAEGELACVDGMITGTCEDQVLPAPEICGDLEDQDCDGDPECDGEVLWALSFGDDNDQEARDVVVDALGNVVVAGVFQGSFMVGDEMLISAGGWDIFVFKLDPSGEKVWVRRFGDAADQSQLGVKLALDSQGNVLLVGSYLGTLEVDGATYPSTNTDGYVIKLMAADGTDAWMRPVTGPGPQRLTSVAVDPTDDQVLVTGFYSAPLTIDGASHPANGTNRVFTARLLPDGSRLWSKDDGAATPSNSRDIALLPTGDFAICGEIEGPTDFGSGVIGNANADEGMYALRYTRDGDLVAQAAFGETGNTNCAQVASTASGNLFVAGAVNGAVNFGQGLETHSQTLHLTELQARGTTLAAQRTLFLPVADDANGLVVGADGYLGLAFRTREAVTVGSVVMPFNGGTDAGILKLDPMLGHLWSYAVGDMLGDVGRGIALRNDGGVVAVGDYRTSATLGDVVLTAEGMRDLFVVRFAP